MLLWKWKRRARIAPQEASTTKYQVNTHYIRKTKYVKKNTNDTEEVEVTRLCEFPAPHFSGISTEIESTADQWRERGLAPMLGQKPLRKHLGKSPFYRKKDL